MTRMTGLSIAIAAVMSLAMASDSQAFWGSRGSCGSSGGSWGSSGGSWGSSGGSWGSSGSSGSHGGLFSRIFHRGGSCGSSGGYSSCGSSGGYSSCGSSGGAVYYSGYGDGGAYVSTSRPATSVVASAAPAAKTQLTLRVPADAKVTLAGVTTKQTGELRQFTTSNLANGQAWQNYQVVVEMNQNGKPVREERTITLVGGQAQELSFSPSDTKVARLTP